MALVEERIWNGAREPEPVLELLADRELLAGRKLLIARKSKLASVAIELPTAAKPERTVQSESIRSTLG